MMGDKGVFYCGTGPFRMFHAKAVWMFEKEKGRINMKTLEKVSDFVGKYMAAIVIVVAAGALFFPGPFSVVKTSWVNNLLGIVMFGMGLTLKPNDFKVVFSRPKDVIVGCVA